MTQATETFQLGTEQATVVVEIDLSTVWLISGNFSGTIPSGQVGFINGNVNLTGDLIVEGLLTGIDTFTLTGNGFQILVQNGGQLNLQGVEKSGWVPWGDLPVGWNVGDRLGIAPTAAGIFVPSASTWNGAWGVRPTNAPSVALPNGVQVEAEVANLTRTITLNNLSRIHFHDGAGVQTLRHIAITNSGISGVLSRYPLHFHLCGESVRGSLVEGVVVEGGKNHAFVPHGSHGITFRDCVAYNTINDAYWWDLPSPVGSKANNSNDTAWENCLAMWVKNGAPNNGYRLCAFMLGTGTGNSITHSVASCVQGTTQASGFHWPEQANGNDALWVSNHLTFHNNKVNGIFTWQNDFSPHLVEDCIGYHNGESQIDHGAYENVYHYRRIVLQGGLFSFKLHAVGGLVLEDIIGDKRLLVTKHSISAVNFATARRCSFDFVSYNELNDGGFRHSKMRYEDCPGLVPAEFLNMNAAIQSSIAEVYEAGVLAHRWTQGAWT